MELATTNFISIDGTTVSVNIKTIAEAKIALKELRLKKKEYGLLKRALAEEQREIRADYTHDVRTRGSMLRGGGGFGRFIRLFQTISRDNKKSSLAAAIAPFEHRKQLYEGVIRSLDSAIIQVEAHLLKNAG